ncbi:MAG: hypothetical protein GYB53_18920 [Rhodobacteraceae bacterium]|nr:hypothetical protein [Paracoccaceae bacterium]MBR9823932.1 hypothetical protein [Paracoccaceae bacterium]
MMNLQHSSEQDMLRDSLAAAFARSDAKGADWGPVLAAQGALALLTPEDLGGLGLGMVDATVAAVEAGRACLDYPLADTMLMAGALAVASPDMADELAEGRLTIVAPSSGRFGLTADRLVGTVKVSHPELADWLAAPVGDDRVALVRPADLEIKRNVTVDPAISTATIRVDMNMNLVPTHSVELVEEKLALLRCADLLGAAEFCFETGIQYIKDRRQFGQPIGANQALKHMAADCFVELENCRVAIDYAAAILDQAANSPAARVLAQEAVSVALCCAPLAARRIAEEAIQFHGGIGVTWEYPLNRYLRRILRVSQSMGRIGDHQRRLLCQVVQSTGWQDDKTKQARSA